MLQPPVRGFNRSALSRRRQAENLSIAELGVRADIAASVLSRWESGQASPTPELLRRVADAMGVSTTEFVDTPAEDMTLADLRSLAGFSQRSLARHLGIPFKAVAKLEQGLIDMDDKRATTLAAALDVDVAELHDAYRRGARRWLRQRLVELEAQQPAAASA